MAWGNSVTACFQRPSLIASTTTTAMNTATNTIKAMVPQSIAT